LSLTKVTIVKMFGKISRCKLCCGVATYYVATPQHRARLSIRPSISKCVATRE